jgi:protein TonB
MSGLALPPAKLLRASLTEVGAQQFARRWPARLQARGITRPPAILMARPEAARLPVTRQRTAGPLAMSLFGHAALLAAGLVATLLLPSAPPAPAFSPPAFSVELAFAPTPTAPAPAQPAPTPEPADLADAVPQPQPPPEALPDALVMPQAVDMAAALPAPDAPPPPLSVPDAAELAAVLPAPSVPPAPIAVPTATDMAAVLADPTAPPAPVLEPPPAPALAQPPQAPPVAHPAKPAAHKRPPAKPAPAKPATAKSTTARTAAAPPTSAAPGAAIPGPAAAPPPIAAPIAAPADAAPMLIATPRFRVPPRPPVYPRRAIELRAQGEALIGAQLDPTGTPHEVRVLRSSGHPMLDRAALDAVGGWAFEPGRRAGQPVAARVEIPVRFTLR